MPTVYFVVPCYNEEEVLPETIKRLTIKLAKLIKTGKASVDSRMIFVDDGSKDKTWEIIEQFHQENRLEVIDQFIDKYNEGCEVVYGVRSNREKDTAFKRGTAQGYYKFMAMLGVDIVYNHADYRLMGKRALDALAEYKEVNLFLRGIVPLIGYKSDYVYYERNERFAGESKYPLKKMIKFAVDGITSFSVKPLKIISNIGIIMCLLSVIFFVYALVSFFSGSSVAGWASIMCSIWFLGGLQMLGIGIVGTYVGKIYSESKRRPRFIIDKTIINK